MRVRKAAILYYIDIDAAEVFDPEPLFARRGNTISASKESIRIIIFSFHATTYNIIYRTYVYIWL